MASIFWQLDTTQNAAVKSEKIGDSQQNLQANEEEQVTCESEDIQFYSTCDKTTDLFSIISKYDKIQYTFNILCIRVIRRHLTWA